jgi:hypothetical protein
MGSENNLSLNPQIQRYRNKRCCPKVHAFVQLKDIRLKAVSGGARRDRTADLYNAIVALSQLSYGPEPSAGI